MTMVILVTAALVLLCCSSLGQIDLLGLGLDFLRNRRFQRDWDQFQTETIDPYNQALRANAGSLGQIGNTTQMADQSYNRAIGLTQGLSNQNRLDVMSQGRQAQATAEAGLRARGLTGSTIIPSVRTGIQNSTNAELRRVNDDRLMSLLGVEGSFGGQRIATSQAAQQARMDALLNQYLVAPQQPPQTQLYGRRYG